MNDRYARDYWLIRLTPAAAQMIVDYMSTKTLKRHQEKCLAKRGAGDFRMDPIPDWLCERNHAPLWVPRWIESGMTIGKRRAHLKLPKGDDKKLYEFAERLEGWAGNTSAVGRSGSVLKRAAAEIMRQVTNHPLETLAEALDDL